MKRGDHPHKAMPRAEGRPQAHEAWPYIPAGVAQLDTAYRLVQANATARRYVAVLGAGTVGEPMVALGGTPIQALLTPRPGDLPHEVVSVDLPPRVFTIRAYARPAADAGGWVLLIQDVTAERHLQEQQAQQERLAAMQRLVAGVANEFHQTLCSIVGYAELLQMPALPSQILREDLAAIAEWGHRGLKMARHLLDFSGQTVSRLRPRDMRLVLTQLLPHLQRVLPDTIRMVLESRPGTYLVELDVAHTLQLLLHLTLNARDAMPEGGELCLRLSHATSLDAAPLPYPSMQQGTWVKLTVSDTGKGMPPEVQARLFDPFFTTQSGRRTGLGLTQVYSTMKQHGGYMTVASGVGQGTIFSLYFPARRRSAETILQTASDDVPSGQGKTLMVVDSAFSNREALRLTLRYLGYEVLTAANGHEALTRCEARAGAIDLVLNALMPTERGGLALVRAFRQHYPHVKVIALVEALYWDTRHELLAQGATTCLRQPTELPLLAQAVRQVLTVDD